MLNRNEFEIRELYSIAEGAHCNMPTESQIAKSLKSEGFECSEIDICFDSMQGLWRWTCNIQEVE